MNVRVRIHEEILVHRNEVVGRVHSVQHERAVHLGVHWCMLSLWVVVGLCVVVEDWVDSLGSVSSLVSTVNWSILADTKHSIHVLFRYLIIWELEAQLVIAKKCQLSIGTCLVLGTCSSGLENQNQEDKSLTHSSLASFCNELPLISSISAAMILVSYITGKSYLHLAWNCSIVEGSFSLVRHLTK